MACSLLVLTHFLLYFIFLTPVQPPVIAWYRIKLHSVYLRLVLFSPIRVPLSEHVGTLCDWPIKARVSPMSQLNFTNNYQEMEANHLRVNTLIVLIGSSFQPGRFACLKGVYCCGDSKSRTLWHKSTVRLNSYTNYNVAVKEAFVFHLESQVENVWTN